MRGTVLQRLTVCSGVCAWAANSIFGKCLVFSMFQIQLHCVVRSSKSFSPILSWIHTGTQFLSPVVGIFKALWLNVAGGTWIFLSVTQPVSSRPWEPVEKTGRILLCLAVQNGFDRAYRVYCLLRQEYWVPVKGVDPYRSSLIWDL